MFLASYRPFFSQVVVTARDTTAPEAKALAEQGAELAPVNSVDPVASFMQAFQGADAVVNLLGKTPHEFRDAVGDAAIRSGVAVYFPSEYGVYVSLSLVPATAVSLAGITVTHLQ